ncbi:MAG TPA: methylated-DNA--[protein]-cysteine S-methyltransferase [Gaiellaceae bacterium]|jgi:methylated-DNA-[protein]-cysteine S-methyltransferase
MDRMHTIIATPLGRLTAVAEDGALTGIYFPGHWTRPDPRAFGERTDVGFDEVERQLAEYFDGERTRFELRSAISGSPFQRQVWEKIDQIPYGETTTYGEIAAELGSTTLARKVGGAVGHNPLSIVIPCHRVVGRDGRLTGYAGGLERKQLLLELEGAAIIEEETPAARLF